MSIYHKYRLGYTEGFNNGLENKPNNNFMPEKEWMPKEKTEQRKMIPFSESNMTEEEYSEEESKITLDTYKTAYCWGHKHALEERERLKKIIPAELFENMMWAFSNAFRIIYLEINKELYLFSWRLDPELAKQGRQKLINEFLCDTENSIPDKTKLKEILSLLNESKLQRAIDHAVEYFREQKQLLHFCDALLLKSRLMDSRDHVKYKEITIEDSNIEKQAIAISLSEKIEMELNSTNQNFVR